MVNCHWHPLPIAQSKRKLWTACIYKVHFTLNSIAKLFAFTALYFGIEYHQQQHHFYLLSFSDLLFFFCLFSFIQQKQDGKSNWILKLKKKTSFWKLFAFSCNFHLFSFLLAFVAQFFHYCSEWFLAFCKLSQPLCSFSTRPPRFILIEFSFLTNATTHSTHTHTHYLCQNSCFSFSCLMLGWCGMIWHRHSVISVHNNVHQHIFHINLFATIAMLCAIFLNSYVRPCIAKILFFPSCCLLCAMEIKHKY